MTRVLALDVGGTNVRLAIATLDGRAIRIDDLVQGPGRAHATFEDALLSRRSWWSAARVQRIAIACAGPVIDGVCHMTNLGWVVDARAIAGATGLPTRVINDFEAVALGVRFLPRENLAPLQAASADPNGVIAILGAGTGMGQALVVPGSGGDRVIPTEGGHATLAPVDDEDARFIAFARKKIGGGHVSVERALAGAGLVTIFEWIVAEGLASPGDPLRAAMTNGDPAGAIGAAGTAGTDPAARAAVDRFVRFYGSEAGNLALKSIPRGGVYIAGGIAPKILPRMREGFVPAFLDKGRMRTLLESIPVNVIDGGDVALRGSAAIA